MLITKNQKTLSFCALLFALSITKVAAQTNVVTNGNFSAGGGSFSGWTQFGDTTYDYVATPSAPYNVYRANFGAVGTTSGIRQSLSIVAGGTYRVSYYLANDGGTPNSALIRFSGQTLQQLTNAPNLTRTLYSYTTRATGGGVLSFEFQQNPAWYSLDTVSVTPLVSDANTLAAVQQSAAALSGVYNVQAAALQAGLTYDCNTFDEHGLCASIGGRATYGLTAPSGNQQAGLVVVSHKPDAHFRYGGFADQSVATASPNGIKYNNSGPMFGFFGYWNQQKDNLGWGASVTTAFSNSNLTVTRNASLASTEAGSGNTEMQGQAVQAQATYAVQATTKIKAQPYLGLRYYRVATGGYSEGSNADVTSPLTYNAMAQEVFAAVGGVGTSVFLAEKLTGNASVGIQQNLNYKMGNYQGTSSISGLESFSVNMPSNINSMATASAGLTYAVKKNEKLGMNVLWQQQAFAATNTITALATYSIGF